MDKGGRDSGGSGWENTRKTVVKGAENGRSTWVRGAALCLALVPSFFMMNKLTISAPPRRLLMSDSKDLSSWSLSPRSASPAQFSLWVATPLPLTRPILRFTLLQHRLGGETAAQPAELFHPGHGGALGTTPSRLPAFSLVPFLPCNVFSKQPE